MKIRVLALVACLWCGPALAQLVEVPEENPQVGKEKATEYFKERKAAEPAKAAPAASNPGATPRHLMIHVGTFVSDQGFKWGDGSENNIGRLNAGVTYRMGEWVNSMDWSIRIDYMGYKVTSDQEQKDARKISFSALLTFPDANSRFPLYFGGGIGPGFFIKQVDNESPITADYSLFLGARFHDVIDRTGFLIEAGLKNHFHLFSDGQFNGVYVNAGCVFAF